MGDTSGAGEFGAESLGPEEHARCLKEEQEKKLQEWAKRQAIEAFICWDADQLLRKVLIDLVEHDMNQHPEKSMEESAKYCVLRLRYALVNACAGVTT